MQESIIDSVAEVFIDLGIEASDNETIRIMAMILTELNIMDSDD